MNAGEPNPKEVEPLWRQAIPDREPWRRGREAIIIISTILLIGEGVLIVVTLMSGHIEDFFVRLITGWFAALLLYFVWIGQNWTRWLMAPLFAAYGCWDFVWGIVGGDGQIIMTGIASLIIFIYLAISPAVYAFARHQREHASLWEALAITGVFLLLLLSLGGGIYGFYNYQRAVKADTTEFARMTFHRVFENRDPEFLAEHSSATRRLSSPRAFINQIDSELGDVDSVGPVGATFQTKFIPYHLEVRGTAKARVIFHAAPAWVSIEISGSESNWKIEHISRNY
jgi:hypothetical protein